LQRTMTLNKKQLLFLVTFLLLTVTASAFEHIGSTVNFMEYEPKVIQKNLHRQKPFFLLFAAQWCHWCHVFNDKTLADEKVYHYLNKNFVNIFIDADINSVAYQKYKAKGVPYTVFLNPDSSLYFKYSGTLYAKPFLEIIQEVNQSVKKGLSVNREEKEAFQYYPPTQFNKNTLANFRRTFVKGVLDNFDLEEYGIGNRAKSILPETFIYLLNTAKDKNRQDSLRWISATLLKAIEKIYDPVEGGFFRYAETRDWQVPHYEKMAGLNAGTALLLYKVDQEKPHPKLKKAAEQTIEYLSNTLYNADVGSFLSFQEADTSYYFLNKNRRANVDPPFVIEKIFTDNLAVTLNYLLEALNYTGNKSLEKKVLSSLDFLAEMILNNERLFHYYSVPDQKWRAKSGLADYAFQAKLFQHAAAKFQSERFRQVAQKILHVAQREYFDVEKQIFIDPELAAEDYEYLMEMNGGLAFGFMEQTKLTGAQTSSSAEPLITYYSGLEELLEVRLWAANDWEFLERYASFLNAADQLYASSTNP